MLTAGSQGSGAAHFAGAAGPDAACLRLWFLQISTGWPLWGLLWCQSHFTSTCHSYQLRLSVSGVWREGGGREAAVAQRSLQRYRTRGIHLRVVSSLAGSEHTLGVWKPEVPTPLL